MTRGHLAAGLLTLSASLLTTLASAPGPGPGRTGSPVCHVFARDTLSIRIGLDSCRQAEDRLERLLGAEIPMGAVVLRSANAWELSEHEQLIVPVDAAWTTWWMDVGLYALRPQLSDTSLAERRRRLRNMLPHEIAHRMVGAVFFPGTDGHDPEGYGTPLPDWIDDGLAQIAEFSDSYAVPLTRLAANWSERIPLERLVSEPHPVWRQRARLQARIRGEAPPPEAEAVPPTWIWYGQSLALTLYLVERCGDDFPRLVRALADRPDRWPGVSCIEGAPAELQPRFEDWFRGRYLE